CKREWLEQLGRFGGEEHQYHGTCATAVPHGVHQRDQPRAVQQSEHNSNQLEFRPCDFHFAVAANDPVRDEGAVLIHSLRERAVNALVLFLSLALSADSLAGQASIEAAMQLVAAGKLDQAASMLLELEKASPADPEVQYRFGLVLLKQGKLDEAR